PRPAPQQCSQALARADGGAVGGTMERGVMTRDEALALMHEHTQSPSLRQHMLAVEAAMRAYAEKYAEDAEPWGIVGLLHDFDYERYPNDAHSATEEHPSWGVRLLRGKGLPDALCRAILGHASYCRVPRDPPRGAPRSSPSGTSSRSPWTAPAARGPSRATASSCIPRAPAPWTRCWS